MCFKACIHVCVCVGFGVCALVLVRVWCVCGRGVTGLCCILEFVSVHVWCVYEGWRSEGFVMCIRACGVCVSQGELRICEVYYSLHVVCQRGEELMDCDVY